ncbi:MAG: hypothetical protein PVG07_10555 [Acidobacteriota bacterium]|jgi:hypothetical protein
MHLFERLSGGICALVAVVALAALVAGGAPALAQSEMDEGSAVEELRREVERLKAEVEELKASKSEEDSEMASEEGMESGPADAAEGLAARLEEIERRIAILAEESERREIGEAAVMADESELGFGPAASKIYRTEQGLSIGGYGEMLYENFESERDDGADSDATDELDFLRGIVYFGYKFNDNWLFNSEIEFEHASTGEEGSASVEFAYLDYLWKPELNARAGLLLVPMGFVNELHEPTVFLGARRPDVESRIIPTTWRENGFGLFGEVGPVSYRTYIVNGLEGAEFSGGGLRGGRQKGSKAIAEDFAWVGRIDYEPVPGLLLGGSAYVGDSGQGLTTAAGEEVDLTTTILEGHAEWRWRGLELRFLGARADLDDAALFNRATGLTGSSSVGEELSGWYAQAGYDVLSRTGSGHELIPYVRWEELDTQDSVPAGFTRNPANDQESLTLGLAWKPFPQAIVKADYQDYDNGAGTGLDQLNVALGYIF